jgi:cytochrome c553
MENSYGRTFQESREIVLKRDNYTCVDCGNKELLKVHHLDYTSDEPDNLITLCASCHRKRHPINDGIKMPKLEMKTITVKDETHARLRRSGISGESMDVIINRLLDCEADRHQGRDIH